MAIAFDSSALGVENTSSWNHTISGANTILFVTIAYGASDSVSTAKYAGVDMTLTDRISNVNGIFDVYHLINPTAGTNSVAFTGTFTKRRGASVSYTGANQTTQPDAFISNSTSNGTTTITQALTVVNSNCWLIAIDYVTISVATVNAGMTSRQNAQFWASTSRVFCVEDSNGVISSGSVSTTFTYNAAQTANYKFCISINPFVSPNSGGDFFAFF